VTLTDSPVTEGSGAAVTVVLVAAWSTPCTAVPVDAVKSLSPL